MIFMPRKKNKPNIELDVHQKMGLIKEILENVYDLLELFSPILNKIFEMEEAERYKEDGTLVKAAKIFGDIAEKCKDIEGTPSPEFFKNLGN